MAAIDQFKPRSGSFPELLEFVRNRLNAALPANPLLERHGLSVIFAALGRTQRGFAVVTNFERPWARGLSFDDISPRGQLFEQYLYIADVKSNPKLIIVSGAIGPDSKFNGLRRKIVKCLHKIQTSGEIKGVLDALVNLIRLQRISSSVGYRIGANCTAVVIGSDFKSTFHYYSKDRKEQRFPHIVGDGFSMENLVITAKPDADC